MTEEERKDLLIIVRTAVQETMAAESDAIQKAITAHESSSSHRYLDVLISRAEKRQEMYDKIKGSFIFWLLVSSTSAIGWAVWESFVRHVADK